MRTVTKSEATELAPKMWAKMSENQKCGIRFGMTDVAVLRAEGFDPYKDETRELTIALMGCAENDGGMRA